MFAFSQLVVEPGTVTPNYALQCPYCFSVITEMTLSWQICRLFRYWSYLKAPVLQTVDGVGPPPFEAFDGNWVSVGVDIE